MEKIGKVEIKSPQEQLQKYLTTCSICGSVLVFTKNDIHDRVYLSDYKCIKCPDCGDKINVMVERKSLIGNKKKLILKRGVRKISINKYKQLKSKFAGPPTYMPEKIVTERPAPMNKVKREDD